MKTLIITDNVRQADFICKGFYYENLPSEVCLYSELSALKDQLCFYDGIFLLFNSVEKFQEYGTFCNVTLPALPLIFLAQNDSREFRTIIQSLKVQYFAVRPFSFRTIAAEMRVAIFQTKEAIEESNFVLRDIELDILGHRFLCNGHEIQLRNKEFSLLHFFLMHQEKVLSRTELLENVWDRNASILTNTVDVHISQLRKKIRAFSDDDYIRTVPCRGYIFA